MDLILHIPQIGSCLNTLVYGVMYRTSLEVWLQLASGLIGRVCCYLNCISEPSWTDTVENIQSYLTRQCYLTLLPASTSLNRTCSVLSFSSITCTVALCLHVGILSEIFVSKRLCCEIVPLVEKKHGDRSTAAS